MAKKVEIVVVGKDKMTPVNKKIARSSKSLAKSIKNNMKSI